jgi:hypothetical protein
MAFNYKDRQVSWHDMRKNNRVGESLSVLLGTVDKSKQPSSQDISQSIKNTLALVYLQYSIDNNVHEIGNLTITDLIEVKGLGSVRISNIYEFYANLASFEPHETEIIKEYTVSELAHFSDQIKMFDVRQVDGRTILTIGGRLVHYLDIISIQETDSNDGIEITYVKRGVKFKRKKSKNQETIFVPHYNIGNTEMSKLVELVGKLGT